MEPVEVAVTAARARRGLIPMAAGRALLVRGSLVHGFGMVEGLLVTGLDPAGLVLETFRLRRHRIVHIRGAAWILEQAPEADPPPSGMVLSLGPSLR